MDLGRAGNSREQTKTVPAPMELEEEDRNKPIERESVCKQRLGK